MESKTPQSSSSSSLQEKKKTSYELRPEAELRLEVGSTPIDIILESGTAEAFGVELFIKKVYTVESTSIAIFSYHGCKLEIHGTPTSAYVSNDTPMLSYLNVHDGLEKMRRASETEGSIGPRIMIVGQTDTGKSTIARILCNYAVRAGWQPVYVDVDVGQSSISIPGVIGATPVEHLIGGDDLVHHTIKSVSSLFFGHSSPGPNVSLYNSLCKRLATTVEKRLERKDCPARASGVVINTAGWVDGEGYDVLMNIAQSFQVCLCSTIPLLHHFLIVFIIPFFLFVSFLILILVLFLFLFLSYHPLITPPTHPFFMYISSHSPGGHCACCRQRTPHGQASRRPCQRGIRRSTRSQKWRCRATVIGRTSNCKG